MYKRQGKFADRNLTVSDLIQNKGKKKYLQTTATDSSEASAAKEAGIDMLLCKSPVINEIRKGAPDIFLTATIDLALFPSENEVLHEAFRAMSAGADQINTNQKNFDKINDKSIDITPMVELMKDNPNGLDEPTKEHIRSMDISIKRLVEDSNQASKQLASELRSEIKLLAKTISAAVEKNKK